MSDIGEIGNRGFPAVPASVYGPNGNRVKDLVAHCRALTPADLARLQEVLEADFLEITDETRVAAIGIVQGAGRSDAWKAALSAVGDAVEEAVPRRLAGELSGAIFAVPAWAALALIVDDLLSPQLRDILVGPWLGAGMPLS